MEPSPANRHGELDLRARSGKLVFYVYNRRMPKLEDYHRKRKFSQTPEPSGERAIEGPPPGNRFVVQKHDATRLHYDFRLEIDGALKSWAVPKGPSLNPADKRLAVQTEDHPLDYGGFEGVIPKGNYGAGPVMVWDNGTFAVESGDRKPSARAQHGAPSATEQVARGEIKFSLQGQKLRGSFVLVKLRRSEKGNEWLLIKHQDSAADPSWNIEDHDGSVLSGRTLREIEERQPPYFSPGSARASASESPAEPASIEAARRAKMPERIEPMLATLADKPFSHPEWVFEIKLDGVRAIIWVRGGEMSMRSRTGRVVTAQYPELGGLPAHLSLREAILDGEIVVLDEGGRSNFERLQSRINVASPSSALVRQTPVICYLFDILYAEGYDLRACPLIERKRFLRQVLDIREPFRYADHQEEKGKELFELARDQRLEGVIGKQARSPYSSGRSPLWVKFKTVHDLDAVVAGWTAPRGSREHFGALLVGLYDGKHLRFIGGVGTGFNEETQKETFDKLKELEVKHCPFSTVPETKEAARWAEPKLVARVKYSNWTAERRLRAPVFMGLRPDRSPEDCRFESERADRLKTSAAPPQAHTTGGPVPSTTGRALSDEREIEHELFHGRRENVAMEIDGHTLRLSNLNKIYFPESRITKRHLLAYYYRMAPYVLPFLKDRPLVLRRYPDGITGQPFFQKDAGDAVPDWMETATIHSEDRNQDIRYYIANHRAALLYLTNLGCIDHNPWSSRRGDLEHPDYVFFDLDPSAGTEFATVITVARAVLQKLQAIHVEVFLKTSGATGFHLWAPLEPHYTYEQIRTFAEIVGRLVAADLGGIVTYQRVVEKRPPGTVLIDASQNAYGRPLAAPYTVRAFPKAPVSTPIEPRELRAGLRPERLNLKSLEARLQKHGDLWASFWERRQRLEEAIDQLMADRKSRPSQHKIPRPT